MMYSFKVVLSLSLLLLLRADAVDVLSMKAVHPHTATDEEVNLLSRLAKRMIDEKERRRQNDQEIIMKMAFHTNVIAPAAQSPRPDAPDKERKAQVTMNTGANYGRPRKLQATQEPLVFCVDREIDRLGLVCVVTPNFPGMGLITYFYRCTEGDPLADCLGCVVAKVCCQEDFDVDSTELCDFCVTCSSSSDPVNAITYGCSDTTCPLGYDCSNTCIEPDSPAPSPVVGSESPVTSPEPPVVPSMSPAVQSNSPVAPTVASASPVVSSESPVLDSESPVAGSMAPMVSSGSPIAVSPVSSSESPVVGSVSPVASSGSPVLVSVSPVASTDSPVKGSVSPVASSPDSTPLPTSSIPTTTTDKPTRSCDSNFEALLGCFIANNCDVGQCFNNNDVSTCAEFNFEVCRSINCCPACRISIQNALDCFMRDQLGSKCDFEFACDELATPLPVSPPPTLTPTSKPTPKPTPSEISFEVRFPTPSPTEPTPLGIKTLKKSKKHGSKKHGSKKQSKKNHRYWL